MLLLPSDCGSLSWPAGLIEARLSDGTHLVAGKTITAFTMVRLHQELVSRGYKGS